MPTEQSQLCNPRPQGARWKAPCAVHSCLQLIFWDYAELSVVLEVHI